MKATGKALAIAAAITLFPASGVWAASGHMATHATLQVVKAYKGRAAFAHTMAVAKLRYAKGDVYVTVTADHLPGPATLGKRAYVVYASDGNMTDRVGALKFSGMVAKVTGEVMMTKVTDIYVYAEKSAQNKQPHGTEVLAAMVG